MSELERLELLLEAEMEERLAAKDDEIERLREALTLIRKWCEPSPAAIGLIDHALAVTQGDREAKAK